MKTAVEWLEIEIKKQIFQCEDQWQCGYQKALNEVVFLLKQAKEMEKEQKISFANQFAEAVMGGCMLTPTEFYNETFKSE